MLTLKRKVWIIYSRYEPEDMPALDKNCGKWEHEAVIMDPSDRARYLTLKYGGEYPQGRGFKVEGPVEIYLDLSPATFEANADKKAKLEAARKVVADLEREIV